MEAMAGMETEGLNHGGRGGHGDRRLSTMEAMETRGP